MALVLGVVAVLVAALFLITTRSLRVADDRTEAETRRFESVRLANGLRQSIDDQTRMVRLYVSTGERRYRDHYDEILGIRQGIAPRPRNWSGPLWDYVLANGLAGVRYGPSVSIVDLMRRQRFAPREFAALNAARRASNTLTIVERDVMRRVEPLIEDGVDRRDLPALRAQYGRLVDQAYHRQRARITRLVERVVGLVDARTKREVEALGDRNERLLGIQALLLGLTFAASLGGFVLIGRTVVRPLVQLTAATRRIAGGDYGRRASVRGVAELGGLADDFNEMAAAVESDIAARERAQAEAAQAREVAEQASRAKSTFLATMSHEIRTPMAGVLGMLEVLERTELDPSQRHMASVAQSSARSLLLLIGDVLDFSKIEAGKLEIVPATVSLRAVADGSVASFQQLAAGKGLALTSTVARRLARAHVADPVRVRQILNNFLSNAIKFTDDGAVQLAASVLEERPDAQRVELSVTDTGAGLSEEQQRSLFREFQQAGSTSSSRYGGTGLGLVICRRLAEAMGGEIVLESSPGEGTTIRLRLTLPVGDPQQVEQDGVGVERSLPSRPKPSRADAEREGSLLLLADDHPVNRAVFEHQADLIGFVVDQVPDARTALEAFRRGRYGLVLTDLNMPDMDGVELAAAIRELEAREGRPRTPVIALTASVLRGERERCLEAGMDDFIARPTTIPFLAEKLRQWLPRLDWGAAEADGQGSQPASEVLDSRGLERLTGGDPELVADLLADYVGSSRADLASVVEAASRRARGEVFQRAHRIKSSSELLGALEVADVARRLESASDADEPDWAAIDTLVDELSSAVVRVVEEVERGRA